MIFKKKETKKDENQFELGLEKNKKEVFYKLKSKIDYYESLVSLTSLWKSNLFWITVCVDLAVLVGGLVYYSQNKLMFPKDLPYLLSQDKALFINQKWELVIMLAVPFLFDILFFLIAQKIVGRMKTVLNIILMFKLLASILFLIFVWQIKIMFLVY